MRYVVAMICAVVVALAATLLVSSPIASWVVASRSYESPDEVADMHGLVFMGINIAALVLGWIIGWIGGRALEKPQRPI